VHGVAANLEAERARDFRRLLAISALLHTIGVVFFVVMPPPRPDVSLPPVVSVELVAAPPGARAPIAKPKPLPPIKKKVVLPKQPKAVKPVPKASARPKPKPAPRAKPEPKPEPKPEAGYEDVLAQLRSEQGATAPRPAAVAGAGRGSGRGVRISPEEAAWRRAARIHVRQAWVLAPGFRTQPLETLVTVRLDAEGNVLGQPKVQRSSGNPWYDDSTVRAIQKAAPLPPPPAAGEWLIQFRPEDYF
jgi:TonB family protein